MKDYKSLPLVPALLLIMVAGFALGEITFGSCPNKCSCDSDLDSKLIIDCTGAEYDYVPVTAIPCNTKKLIFKNNELQKLTRLSFIGLRELEEIDLAGNFISYIEPETFAGLPNLNRVNLAENEMQTLERYYFRATTFERIYLSLDGNNFYCNEDLKEEINAIKHKIDVGGLVCTGGEIWRVFGKVRGRNYEDIESQIRKNFDSWEIALLTVACFIVVCIGLFIALVVLRLRSKGYQTGESVNPKEGATKRDPNVRASVRDSMMDEGPSNNESSNPSGRRIEITSEDPYNNDDDDDMIFTPASAQPQNNDPGHHTPPNEFNNDSRI